MSGTALAAGKSQTCRWQTAGGTVGSPTVLRELPNLERHGASRRFSTAKKTNPHSFAGSIFLRPQKTRKHTKSIRGGPECNSVGWHCWLANSDEKSLSNPRQGLPARR
tara:strand:+ start:155597 stop:155920 length:324 start_codon:yes stop_codon:yes gene_type:complete